VGCAENTRSSNSIDNNRVLHANAVNLTSFLSSVDSDDATAAYSVTEVLSDLLDFTAAASYKNGFIVYALTADAPEELHLYFYEPTTGNKEKLDFTIPIEINAIGMRTAENGQVLIIEKTLSGVNGAADNSFNIHIMSEHGLILLIQGPPDAAILNVVLNAITGQIYVHLYDNDGYALYIYNESGEQIKNIKLDSIMQNIIFSYTDNKLFLVESDNFEFHIFYLNEDDYTLNLAAKIEKVLPNTRIFNSKAHSFLINIDTVMYGYNHTLRSLSPIVNWNVNGIPDHINGVLCFDDHYIVFANDIFTGDQKILKLVETNEQLIINEKLIVAKFSLGRNEELEWAVARFNRDNPQYYIELKDYRMYGDAALTRLNLDIIAGNSPDIFEITGFLEDSFLPIRQYIASEVIVDIAPFIERDLDINDYFESALRALYMGDKCYFVVPSFSIQALSGTSSAIGMVRNKSLNELLQFIIADNESGNHLFNTSMSQVEFIEHILLSNIDDFVDYDNNIAKFSSDVFLSLLKAAGNLTYEGETDFLINGARMFTGDQQMQFNQVFTIFDIDSDLHILRGDHEITGIPVSNNNVGGVIMPVSMYAMSAASSNQEAAWKFMQQFYSEQFGAYIYGIPMNRRVLADNIDTFIKRVEENEELDISGIRLFYYDDAVSDLKELFIPFQPAEVTLQSHPRIVDLISTVDRLYIPDDNIMNIVMEEVPVYLHGSRTAEDTARVIQSRVQIYLHELA